MQVTTFTVSSYRCKFEDLKRFDVLGDEELIKELFTTMDAAKTDFTSERLR
jgi:hypothetical protein